MAGIRQSGTAAEMVVRAVLRELRLGYRLNVRSLPGSPDVANKERKFAIFVQGCFWHQHTGCARATIPKRNAEFWVDKFAINRNRDANAIRALRKLGYHVVIIWECQTRNHLKVQQRLKRIAFGRHDLKIPEGETGSKTCLGGESDNPAHAGTRQLLD